jgi:hypothetical protein
MQLRGLVSPFTRFVEFLVIGFNGSIQDAANYAHVGEVGFLHGLACVGRAQESNASRNARTGGDYALRRVGPKKKQQDSAQ